MIIKSVKMSELTSTEQGKKKKKKAIETRRKHEEARRAKEQKRKEIREKMTKGCLQVLEDPRTSPAERVEALKILHDLTEGR